MFKLIVVALFVGSSSAFLFPPTGGGGGGCKLFELILLYVLISNKHEHANSKN
jgi:uncharacterized membrane protein